MSQVAPDKAHNVADSISNFLIIECRERGDVPTNLKLQKLLYYAEAWNLSLRNTSIVKEDFQAWVHGPVLPSQYHRFKKNQWHPIAENLTRPNLDSDLTDHLVEIVDVFGSETAVALELMTHREKPWIEARGNLPQTAPSSAVISKETMKQFYSSF